MFGVASTTLHFVLISIIKQCKKEAEKGTEDVSSVGFQQGYTAQSDRMDGETFTGAGEWRDMFISLHP